MRTTRSRSEAFLLWTCLSLIALAVLAPPLAQPAHAHDFADQRVLWGLDHALDVLSNLPFALAGVAGMVRLAALPPRSVSNMQRAMAGLFFVGLLLTGAGSAWYHLHPDDAGLALDRCGMAVAFAGVLGLAAADRVSERAGAALGLTVLLLGPLAVQAWSATGNVLPWAVLQFGGAGVLLWLGLLRQRLAGLGVAWGLVIAAYAVAKLFELNDAEVFRLTGEVVAGHTLKHVVAALTAWPVLAALGTCRTVPRKRGGRPAAASPSQGLGAMHRSGQ